MSKIQFTVPGADEPGYLRRVRQSLKFSQAIKEKPSPEAIDDLVEFLLPYVTEPADREAARGALWDASEAQFKQLLALVGGGANFTKSAATNGSSSETISEAPQSA